MNKDKLIGVMFFCLSFLFLGLAMTNRAFFDWVFERHQNQWSWYVRPVFLIPFCFFSYLRSWAGIAVTIFCIFTSMFWFNAPTVVPANVKGFLEFEKEWLYGGWDYKKALLATSVPVSFFALAFAFWKRSLIMGIVVVVLMATGKIVWGIYNAGEAGKSIVAPAIIGLVICITLMIIGFRKINKTKKASVE